MFDWLGLSVAGSIALGWILIVVAIALIALIVYYIVSNLKGWKKVDDLNNKKKVKTENVEEEPVETENKQESAKTKSSVAKKKATQKQTDTKKKANNTAQKKKTTAKTSSKAQKSKK